MKFILFCLCRNDSADGINKFEEKDEVKEASVQSTTQSPVTLLELVTGTTAHVLEETTESSDEKGTEGEQREEATTTDNVQESLAPEDVGQDVETGKEGVEDERPV